MEKTYNLGIPDAGLRVIKFEKNEDYEALNNYYNKYLEVQHYDLQVDEEIIKQESVDEVNNLVSDAQKIIDDYKKTHNMGDEEVINFSQSSKEVDEVINTNIKKGESEEMAIKKKLDNKEVAEEEVKTPVNFEEGAEVEEKPAEETPVVEEAPATEPVVEPTEEEVVEEVAKKEDFEADEDKEDDKEDDKENDEEEDEEEAEDEEKVEEAKCEECLDMSKADRKTYEARIATLENNLKAVKAELKVAAPFKALYEEAQAKIAELESYKEDVELDRLKADKEKYASTCNFDALEDEDKDKVQEKIDDYKVSVYDFKAFMADVLKRYSRKQVYSNMERIISYFSMNDDEKKADDVDLPSDKSQADRILDKYSDVL